jgi:hypothetical protein
VEAQWGYKQIFVACLCFLYFVKKVKGKRCRSFGNRSRNFNGFTVSSGPTLSEFVQPNKSPADNTEKMNGFLEIFMANRCKSFFKKIYKG